MNSDDPANPDPPVGERTARRRGQRHSSRPSRSLIALVMALALAVFGGAAWAIHLRSGGTSAASAASKTSLSVAGSTKSADSGEPASTSSPSPSSSSTAPVAPAALVACRMEVTRGDALAAVSATVASDWEGHTSSLTRLEAGQITKTEADATWKRTKLAGPSDMKRYHAASTAYSQSKGACARMGALPSAFAGTGTRCVQRANADSDVAVKVAPVSAAWASHLMSMKAKADTPVARYMAKWHQQVNGAPKILSAYRAAASAVRASPTCPNV